MPPPEVLEELHDRRYRAAAAYTETNAGGRQSGAAGSSGDAGELLIEAQLRARATAHRDTGRMTNEERSQLLRDKLMAAANAHGASGQGSSGGSSTADVEASSQSSALVLGASSASESSSWIQGSSPRGTADRMASEGGCQGCGCWASSNCVGHSGSSPSTRSCGCFYHG